MCSDLFPSDQDLAHWCARASRNRDSPKCIQASENSRGIDFGYLTLYNTAVFRQTPPFQGSTTLEITVHHKSTSDLL